MKKIKYILSIGAIVGLLSCGGGGDDPEPDPIQPPSAATLIFPANNEQCNNGTSASANASQSKVNFQWNIASYATSYTLYVKNLETNSVQNFLIATNQMELNINKGTPYKWWVVSHSTESIETATSAEWKFYNAGDATTSYAPFPADLVLPVMGSSTSDATVTLEWSGSDVDNDIKDYDVFFGTVNPPSAKLNTVTNQTIENVAVTTNTYYWTVLTRDDEGNTSTSQIFQFKVN